MTTRNAPHDGAEREHLSTIPKKRKKNLIAWRLATRIGLKRLTKLPASSNHVFRAFGMRERLSLQEVAPIRPTGKIGSIRRRHGVRARRASRKTSLREKSKFVKRFSEEPAVQT